MNVEALKKRRLTSLVTKAMQIKTTVSYCYISVRMEKIKSTMPNAGEDAEQLELPSTAGREVNNVTAILENSVVAPQKVKHRGGQLTQVVTAQCS